MSCPTSKETVIKGKKLCRHLQEQKWPKERHKNSVNNLPPSLDINHLQIDQRNKKSNWSENSLKDSNKGFLIKAYSARDRLTLSDTSTRLSQKVTYRKIGKVKQTKCFSKIWPIRRLKGLLMLAARLSHNRSFFTVFKKRT